MAKPDTEDGWFRLAYELLPVLLFGNFRVEASIVICEVLAQTYGRGKRPAAKIEPAKIAARSGRKRENIWRGVRELVQAGVIEKTPAGDYLFRKNYAKWRSDQSPLIDTHLQQYCAAYPSLVKSFEPDGGGDRTVSQVDTISAEANGLSVSQVDTVSTNSDGSSVSSVDTPTVSQVDTVSAPPPTTPPVCVRIENSHTQAPLIPPTPDPTPSFRSAEDLEFIAKAIDRLSGQLDTEAVGLELGRQQNTPDFLAIPGWKFWVASHVIFRPGIRRSARRSLKYFCTIASNATPEDFEEIRPHSDTALTPLNGTPQSIPAPDRPRRESFGERQARERREAVERMKEKERVERERSQGAGDR